MFKQFKFYNLYGPEDSLSPTNSSGPLGIPDSKDTDSVLDYFKDTEDDETPEILDINEKKSKTEVKPDSKKEISDEEDDEEIELVEKDEDDEEVDNELEELEKELKGPTEEELELMVPPRRREILAKYPDIFKDFPGLERSFYREQQFTELLPTIDDAKLAVEKARALDNFESELMSGQTEKILSAVKESNPEGFNRLVDDYLPTLAKVDEGAFNHVIGGLVKNTIISMVEEARGTDNQQLEAAAQVLHQFVFGTSKFVPHQPLSKTTSREENPEVKKIEEERQALLRERFESAKTELETKISNTLKATIDANIDPKKTMGDYVRNKAKADVDAKLEEVISQDKRFAVLLTKYWEAAAKDKFSKASMDRIRSAYLSKAKTVLPAVIKSVRNEAIRGMRTREKVENDSERNPRKPKSESRSNPSGDTKKLDSGKSTLEILMED